MLSPAAVVCGTLAFVTGLPPAAAEVPATRSDGPLGALRSPAIRTLVLATAPIRFAFGAIEVALPAFATAQDRPELAGVLLAVWSLGSLVGGLVYGARRRTGPLPRVHLRLAVLVTVGFLPLLLAPSFAVMALLVIPAGLFVAPLIATRNELAGTAAPAGAETEALTWPLTALVGGIALGAATGGTLIDAGSWRTAILAGVTAAALGALVALLGRASLALREPAYG